MAITIYHNPKCSKSRQTLQLLEDNGVTPEIVLYLDTPPTGASNGRSSSRVGKRSSGGRRRTFWRLSDTYLTGCPNRRVLL